MNTQDALGWILLALPIAASFGGLVGAALVKNWMPAREVAVAGADYVEALKGAVETAERYGVTNRLPGVEKFAVAVKEMDAWLDAQGIHAWYGSSHVLHGVDLQIGRGQTVGLLGRNRSCVGRIIAAV